MIYPGKEGIKFGLESLPKLYEKFIKLGKGEMERYLG